MATEPLVVVLFDGQPILEAMEDGSHRLIQRGIDNARINGSKLDVTNHAGGLLKDLRQMVKCLSVNPYRDAILMQPSAVLDKIPMGERSGMRAKDINAVLNALHNIAKGHTQ